MYDIAPSEEGKGVACNNNKKQNNVTLILSMVLHKFLSPLAHLGK